MSKLAKRQYNNSRFPRPLPISIPLLHVSNKYFTVFEVFQSISDTLCHIYKIGLFNTQQPIRVVFDVYTDFTFKIFDQSDMAHIWDNGFYGKGILSRSEPTWFKRMEKKVNDLLNPNDKSKSTKLIYSEEITKQRRLFRDIWKSEREHFLNFEKQIKLNSVNGEISSNDKLLLETEREKLNKLKEDLTNGPMGINFGMLNRSNTPLASSSSSSYPNSYSNSSNSNPNSLLKPALRMEDYDVIIDSNHIRNIEYLELDPCETLFLLHLNIIKVIINNEEVNFKNLLILLIENFGQIFLNNFIIYYHYKSLGWCIKNGLKFSCDWVLYSRGPPFNHAEFSIKIVNENDASSSSMDSLIDISAISRVVSGVKKSLILCFIDGPELNSIEWLKMWDTYLIDDDFFKLINNFSINEINWKRWAPSQTRM